MIVWGGQDANGNAVNTGGVYDPATDTWAATSTQNAPSPRIFHTAVWTGSKMIIWAGTNTTQALNTGGVYDPVTDTWAETSTTTAPSTMYYHAASWTGSRMIVWGQVFDVAGGAYDPATDTWNVMSLANVPTGRAFHTAVRMGSKVIIWGGQGDQASGTAHFILDVNGCFDSSGAFFTLTPCRAVDTRKP